MSGGGGSPLSHNTPFMWNGEDYLYRMHSDINFVVDYLGEETAQRFSFGIGDPLPVVERDGVGLCVPYDDFL